MKKVKYKQKKEKKGMKRIWKIVIIVAAILIILTAGFFGLRVYEDKQRALVFSNGVQFGYAQAIVQMMNLSLSCNPVPVYAGNASLELIAVDCLPQQLQDQLRTTIEPVEQ